MTKLQCNNAIALKKLPEKHYIKTGRLNKHNNKNMNTSDEKEEKREKLTTACAVNVQVQVLLLLPYSVQPHMED